MTPFTIPSAESDPPEPVPPSVGTRPCGVLVVDDQEAVRRMVALGMESFGFAVWIAPDAPTAVELFRLHHDRIDVVLLDVQMPDRDGPETLAELRELAPHLPCCFMSGDTGKYTEDSLLNRGAAAVFRKPLRLNELAQQLREVTAHVARPDAAQEGC